MCYCLYVLSKEVTLYSIYFVIVLFFASLLCLVPDHGRAVVMRQTRGVDRGEKDVPRGYSEVQYSTTIVCSITTTTIQPAMIDG